MKKPDMDHANIHWRGFVLEKWYASTRTCSLQNRRAEGEPYVTIRASVTGGSVRYVAKIFMGCVSAEQPGDTAETALDAAREAVLAFARVLDPRPAPPSSYTDG